MKLINLESAEMKQARQNLEEAETLLREKIFLLGQNYYTEHKYDAGAEYAEQIQLISRMEANRRSFFQKKLQLEGLMMCESCEAIIPYGSTFCNVCGKNASQAAPGGSMGMLPQNQAEGNDVTKCRNCGMALNKDAVFCGGCGTRVNG